MPGFRDANVYPLDRPTWESARTRRGQPPRRKDRHVHQQAHPSRWPSGGSSNGSSPKIGLESSPLGSHSTPHLVLSTKSSGNQGGAMGHRTCALAAELRRSLRVPESASRREVHRGHELHPLRLQRYNRQMRRTANFLPSEGGTGRMVPSTFGLPVKPRQSHRRLPQRADARFERVGCIVLRPVLDLTAVCLK